MNRAKAEILVVEDNPMNRSLLETILMKDGYGVHSAENGMAALVAVEERRPDLILLDIRMPRMDGHEVCERLKSDPATQDIPIIFISANGDVFDKVKAFSAGAVDYLTKPFHPAEILARVGTHLTIVRLQHNLEERVAELDAFAHTVAHDLKNPLALVTSYAEYLKLYVSDMNEDDTMHVAQQLQSAGSKAINIVEELLLLASVRNEKVRLEPLNMAEIVQQSQERLTLMIKDRQARIIPPADWANATGYAPWVEEVWTNYLSNGIKYGGEPPLLQLGFTRESDASIRYWVRDNGRGLDEDQQQELFKEFNRLDDIRVQGHGLGLSIVRRIVHRLGGTVGIESEPGAGATFYFTLPTTP